MRFPVKNYPRTGNIGPSNKKKGSCNKKWPGRLAVGKPTVIRKTWLAIVGLVAIVAKKLKRHVITKISTAKIKGSNVRGKTHKNDKKTLVSGVIRENAK